MNAIRNASSLFLSAALLMPAISAAVDYEITPQDDIQAAVNALQPGDVLILGGGEYRLTREVLINLYGTAAEPIVIRAKTGERPVLLQTNSGRRTVDFDGAAYIEFRGIEINGGAQGMRMREADYITVADCEVHNTEDVAIAVNWTGTYTGLRLVRNHIHHTKHTGEGMYLGCNNDLCRVENSLIDSNYIHHTNGPTVTQGDGIELKEGSSGNIISNNVIHDTNYPGILTYSTVGNGPPNIIEGNVMWNSSENGMQVAADAIIRNNIIIGAPLVFQLHQAGTPSNLEVVNNTIIAPGNGVEVRNVTGSVVIANNAIYAGSGAAINLISGDLNQVTLAGNVGQGGLVGGSGGYVDGNGLAADFVSGNMSGPPIDVFPSATSALIAVGDASRAPINDFNGNARGNPADVGAYTFSASGNPGWTISESFKGSVFKRPNPPVLSVDQ